MCVVCLQIGFCFLVPIRHYAAAAVSDDANGDAAAASAMIVVVAFGVNLSTTTNHSIMGWGP